MTMTAAVMYALDHDQLVSAILAAGNKRTVIVEGPMGSGKSAILNTLAEALPTHAACYFDCTTKLDAGDIMVPNMKEMENGSEFVRYVVNEEFGLHLNQPLIIMLDEIGKNKAILNALLRLMYERKMGSYKLHPDSIIFATTNLGAENLGDLVPAHMRNRVSIVRMRAPTAIGWIEWGINHDIDPVVLGWVRDNQYVLDSFEMVENPDDNEYIFHPKANRRSFVTPRSLEAASDWMKARNKMDNHTLTAMLIGTIGDKGGLELASYSQLADQLPSVDSIKKSPDTAKVPSSPAAVCMVVFRALMSIDATWVDSWFKYLVRLDRVAQSIFVNGVRAASYNDKKRDAVMNHPQYRQWLFDNGWVYSPDKK